MHGLNLPLYEQAQAQDQTSGFVATAPPRKMDNTVAELEAAVERLQKSISSLDGRVQCISTPQKNVESIPQPCAAPSPASPLVEALRRITDKVCDGIEHVRRIEDALDI